MKKIVFIAVGTFMLGGLLSYIGFSLWQTGAKPFPLAGNTYVATIATGAPPTTLAMMDNAGPRHLKRAQTDIEPRIIRTANLAIQAQDATAALSAITKVANELAGFVVSSSLVQQTETNQKGNIAIRVPEAHLAEAIKHIHRLAHTIISEQINAEDVTTDYIDLQARLKVAQAGEQQYLRLLTQTHKVSDTLEVMRQLDRIRSDIESLKGRLNFLENQTSLSLITVDVQQVYQAKPIQDWQLKDQAQLAWQKLIATFKWLIEASVWLLVYLLPISLLFLGMGYLGWKIVKKVSSNSLG